MIRVMVAVLLLALSPTGFGREWQSRTGATVEAEFRGMRRGVVTLVTPEGKGVRIPFEQLSEDDQSFVVKKLPPPDIRITGVKLDRWESNVDATGEEAVFEVTAYVQGEPRMAVNPQVKLEFLFEASKRVEVKETETVSDRRGRSRKQTYTKKKKEKSLVDGRCSVPLFVEDKATVDLSRQSRALRLKIPSGFAKQQDTSYKLKAVKAALTARGKTFGEYTQGDPEDLDELGAPSPPE
jgi:hypothetical protein